MYQLFLHDCLEIGVLVRDAILALEVPGVELRRLVHESQHVQRRPLFVLAQNLLFVQLDLVKLLLELVSHLNQHVQLLGVELIFHFLEIRFHQFGATPKQFLEFLLLNQI